jgi:hypothetical protein
MDTSTGNTGESSITLSCTGQPSPSIPTSTVTCVPVFPCCILLSPYYYPVTLDVTLARITPHLAIYVLPGILVSDWSPYPYHYYLTSSHTGNMNEKCRINQYYTIYILPVNRG